MWTEIHGKLPSEWSRREDLLTGNFFGLLQFASQNSGILYQILEGVRFSLRGDLTDAVSEQALRSFKEFLENLRQMEEQPVFYFWPDAQSGSGKRDEIDLVIDFPRLKCLLGIEVKYISPLSSNDNIREGTEQVKTPEMDADEISKSQNQILRYTRTFSKKMGNDKTCFFLIWAKDAMAAEIFEGITTAENQNTERQALSKENNHIGFMSWEKTAEQLTKLAVPLTFPDSKIWEDLYEYLKFKNLAGFSVFKPIQSKRISGKDGFLFEPFDFQFLIPEIKKHLYYEFN